MIPFIIGGILMYAFFNSPTEQVSGSKNFHMSDGASAAMYKLMKERGMSDENLRRFVIMEDYLLELERFLCVQVFQGSVKLRVCPNKLRITFWGMTFPTTPFISNKYLNPVKS